MPPKPPSALLLVAPVCCEQQVVATCRTGPDMALHRRVFSKRKCGPEGVAGNPSTAVWRALRPIPLASSRPLPLLSAQATPQAQGRGWPCHVAATSARPFGGHENGGCASTPRRAWTCNRAAPRAHELHTDVLDHLATPEGASIAVGREPDTAAGRVKRLEARRRNRAPRANK